MNKKNTRPTLEAANDAIPGQSAAGNTVSLSALKEREAGLRRAQLMANLAHVITKPDGSFESWSETLPGLIGVQPDEIVTSTRKWLDLIHPADRDLFRSAALAARVQAKRADVEYRLRRSDGAWIHVRQVMEPIPGRADEEGRLRWFNTLQDLTDQRRAEAEMRETAVRFRQMAENIRDVFFLVDVETNRTLYLSPAHEQIWGRSRESVYADTDAWTESIHPEDRARVREGYLKGLSAGRFEYDYRIVRPDGSIRWIHARGFPIRDEAGKLYRVTGVAEDITERKEAENKIGRLNRVYMVLSGINALIVRAPHRDELFREACRIAVEHGQFRMAWVGLADRETNRVKPVASDGEVRGFFDSAPLAATDSGGKGQGMAWRAIRGKTPVILNDIQKDPHTSMKQQCLERGINSLAMLPLVVDGEGTAVLALYAGEAGFFDDEEMKLLLELAGDISFALEHIKKSEQVDYLAFYDSLTGLANRTLFHERLVQHVAAANAEGRRVGLVIFDLERFRTINDTLGRHAGDALLKQIAERMVQFTERARVARIGGDHFAVVVPDVRSGEEFARRTETRTGQFFGAPFNLGDTELRVSAKVGVAMFPDDASDADTLFRNAEAALKRAKASGEKFLFYTQEMTERVAEKLSLENKLRQALEKDEFVLHYQPKVDLQTRRIVGVEALIRWQDPQRGLVAPGDFIPLLEETGLILPVGSWALKRAARDHRSWVERGLEAPRVAVNVSPIQLRQRDFVAVVEQAILEGVAPTAIDLEITESLIMDDVKGNIAKLNAVRQLGVTIGIDDFGTGYSSLGYLAKLPVQSLKIDRSFIVAMQNDADAMTLVSTIISLAHSMRLKVVAEGVETEEQATFLRLLRCDQMQGYLFSKPLPMEALLDLMRQQPR
jgi:diguanylate cyclase (GGDEF)-like protein/PAS domain S-box-containing protein